MTHPGSVHRDHLFMSVDLYKSIIRFIVHIFQIPIKILQSLQTMYNVTVLQTISIIWLVYLML